MPQRHSEQSAALKGQISAPLVPTFALLSQVCCLKEVLKTFWCLKTSISCTVQENTWIPNSRVLETVFQNSRNLPASREAVQASSTAGLRALGNCSPPVCCYHEAVCSHSSLFYPVTQKHFPICQILQLNTAQKQWSQTAITN